MNARTSARRTAAVPQGDVELAVEYQEELIGVVMHMPDVLARTCAIRMS